MMIKWIIDHWNAPQFIKAFLIMRVSYALNATKCLDQQLYRPHS